MQAVYGWANIPVANVKNLQKRISSEGFYVFLGKFVFFMIPRQ